MDKWMLAVLAFGLLTFLAATGVHIAISMGVLGLAFGALFLGLGESLSLAGISAWFNAARFSIAMIPLFVLMGTLASVSGIGTDAYRCFYVWMSRLRGSLAMVSVFSCAAFAALTGSSTATVATIGGISIPEMTSRRYSKPLRLGSIAASGTLGILIPPSVILIFYGVLTEVSIGKLFVAGIVPGLVTVALFCVLIYFWTWLNPTAAPITLGERFSLGEKLSSTAKVLPVVLIFALVTFTIYAGICSPEESAAFGVFGMLVVTIAMRRLTWEKFVSAVHEALKISGFLMLIIMAAMLFANSIALSGFADQLSKFVSGLAAPPVVVMTVIILIYLVLGCVLDTFGLMVLTVPIFFPVVTTLGYDPVWFGVLVTVLVECALITPPIGTNIYVTKAVDPAATSLDVIKGVVPFLAMELLLLALLIAFPALATWLPSKMN
jgi:tripartite ATP-independent transporter DctM subunit